MASKDEIISRLIDPGIIAIIRTERAEQVLEICRALVRGGIIAVEITLTIPGALQAIKAAAKEFGDDALVGVGTVLGADACRSALSAGAMFAVSPVVKPEIVVAAHAANRPVMLGAYTPTEAQLAHEAGADFIKIFPAEHLGPGYIRALRGPLPHLRIVPTGGVDLNTATAFLDAGCAALGVGSSLVSKPLIDQRDWTELSRLARSYVDLMVQYRKQR